MRRRDFIAGLGGAALWPVATHAQTSSMPVVGILASSRAEAYAPRLAAFMQGLKEAGFVEGQNFATELRWGNDQYDQLPDMAADLVRRRVRLIAAIGNYLPIRAAKGVTITIPVVFAMGADPVQLGLVSSLSRPGGNITGVTTLAGDQIQKRAQLLHDVVPNAKIFGLINNPDNLGRNSFAGRTQLELVQDAVQGWGAKVEIAYARTVADFKPAFASLKEKRIDALVTGTDVLFFSGQSELVALAAQFAVPMIFHSSEVVQIGGLVGYSASYTDAHRQAGIYAGRILKGEKPADLPVLLPTKFELGINLKTANALGLTIARELLLTADEVIE